MFGVYIVYKSNKRKHTETGEHAASITSSSSITVLTVSCQITCFFFLENCFRKNLLLDNLYYIDSKLL